MLLLRPSVLGGNFTPIGMGVFVGTVGLAFFLLPRPSTFQGGFIAKDFYLSLGQTFSICLLWIYFLLNALVQGQSNFDFVFKSFAASTLVSICFLFLCTWADLKKTIFDIFAKANALVGWSILITWALLKFVPYSALRYFTISVKNYERWDDNGDILFPFSIIYGHLIEYDIYRFSGLFRETGIAQLFFTWAFIYFLNKNKFENKFWMLGALFGILFCGSSIAYASLLLSLLIYFGFNPKGSFKIKILAAMAAGILVLGSLFAPGIGLKDKQTTHAASMDDRKNAVQTALVDADNLLFGKGPYYAHTPFEGMGINAISQIYFTGLVGFALHIFVFIMGFWMAKSVRREYAALIIPQLFTNMLFQPLTDAPTTYLILHYAPFAFASSARFAPFPRKSTL
jgi:hypothetical protein